MKTYKDLYDYIEIDKNCNQHTHYRKGVLSIAMLILESAVYGKCNASLPSEWAELNQTLLNGAENWTYYAYTGNPYSYDDDIAKLLLTPSRYKQWNGISSFVPGHQRTGDMTFLDMQCEAVCQAVNTIRRIHKRLLMQSASQI